MTNWSGLCRKCGHTREAHSDAGTECAACRGRCVFVEGLMPLRTLIIYADKHLTAIATGQGLSEIANSVIANEVKITGGWGHASVMGFLQSGVLALIIIKREHFICLRDYDGRLIVGLVYPLSEIASHLTQ